MPVVALAQGGSPFDTGFTAIQSLFTGTIAKVPAYGSVSNLHGRGNWYLFVS